ncbi:hypothetical protein Micbo1qcDRAFT_205770 [Microdochium bolleyi]|uniref:Uncharacterized protein n=1 Tax=Microdochium bolleyi TaxID=196109 RepID=A0A136IZD0_9PEZI|nr:hypothetical protein Micbo1qcDRAFT_205770 [Microdochium bolleyi]
MCDVVDLYLEIANDCRQLCLQIPASTLSIYARKGHGARYTGLLQEGETEIENPSHFALRLICVTSGSPKPCTDSVLDPTDPEFSSVDNFVSLDLSYEASRTLLQHLELVNDEDAEYPEPESLRPKLCMTMAQIVRWEEAVTSEVIENQKGLSASAVDIVIRHINSHLRYALQSIR